MILLANNLETLLRILRNGHVRISYSLIIIVCVCLLIMLLIVIINTLRKRKGESLLKAKLISETKRNSDLSSDIKYQLSRVETLRNELSSVSSKLKRRDNRIATLNQTLSEKTDIISSLSNEIKSLKTALEEMEKTLLSKDESIKKYKDEIIAKKRAIASGKMTMTILQGTLDALKTEGKSKDKMIDDFKKQLSMKEEQIKQFESQDIKNPFERLANW